MYAVVGMYPGTACVKQEVNGFSISIAFSDFRGNRWAHQLHRAELVVFDDRPEAELAGANMNEKVFGANCGTIEGSIQNLTRAYLWCIEQKGG